jgi:hypothetical protein
VFLVEDALRAQYSQANVTFARGADIDSTSLNVPLLSAALDLAAAADLVFLVLGDSACVGGKPFGRWEPARQIFMVDRGTYDFYVGDCFSSGGLYAVEAPCKQQQVSFTLD